MDEYIKREDAMKALDEYRLSHTMSMHGDMELLMEFRDGVVGAMNALAFVPTANVVPKSEVEQLQKVLAEYEETSGLKQAKADVAMEIFEEIEMLLGLNSFEGDIFTGKYFNVDLENDIAELKKKYTEDKT